jgi:hypothetical protein
MGKKLEIKGAPEHMGKMGKKPKSGKKEKKTSFKK